MPRLLTALCCLSLLALVGCTTPNVSDAGMAVPDAGNDATIVVDGGSDGGSDTGSSVDVGPRDAGPTNQCTNAADMPIAAMDSTGAAVAACGQSSVGNEPALMNCITTMTGLSAPCAACYDGEVHCVIAHCLGAGCAANPGSASCTTCRLSMCHPAFMTCSGLP